MGLMKKMASVLVTASLLFGLVGTAFATTPAEVNTAASRLQELGIVVGDQTGDMKLGDPITRAQLMKIMVWAFGQKDNAAILKGAVAFPDTSTHWASGEIAIAKNIIVEKNHFEMGMPDGNFAPEGKVTAAQAVAFLMKFLGVSPDSSKTWPNNYLDAAVSSGMISASVRDSISATANAEATRGLVFFLADTAFAGYQISSGKTVYTSYVKPTAPTLTVEASELTTTASKVTVSGTVSADAKAVYVGTTSNTVSVSNGSFSTTVDLTMGANSITVGATDVVGGTTTKTLTVTRTVGTAVAIDAPASITVVAGESADLAVTVKDAAGNALTEAAVDVTSEFGAYANGKFTAGEKAGTGTATVKSGDLSVSVNVTVQPGALAKINISPATVDVSSGNSQKFTATGADKFNNEVALTNAVNWSSSKGVMGPDGTFGATADSVGTVTVTATAGTVSGTATATVFGVPAKVQIAAPGEIIANGESSVSVTATVLDAAGNVAKNYNGDVTFASSNTSAISVKTATVAAVNGVATTTLESAGDYHASIISASASGLTGTTVTVTPTAQKITSIKIEAGTNTLAANSNDESLTTLTLTLLDQAGEVMLNDPTDTITVELKSSNPKIVNFGSTTEDTTEFTIDEVEEADAVTVYATSSIGAVTISATVTDPEDTTFSINSIAMNTLIVGPAHKLAIDPIDTAKAASTTEQTATIRVLDYNGNQLTNDTSDVHVTYWYVNPDGDKVTGADADPVNGVITFNANQVLAGSWTLKAKATQDSGAPITDATPVTFSITPGKANKLSFSASPSTIQANGTAQSTLTIKVKDVNGNTVTDGSVEVTIKKSDNQGATGTFAETKVNTSNGVATVVVTGTTKVADDTFTATATDLNGATTTVRTRVMGSAYELAWYVNGATAEDYTTATGTAGDDVVIKAVVQDAQHTPLTYDQGTAVTLTVKNTVTDTVVGTYSATTTNGVAKFTVNQTLANAASVAAYSYTATSTGLKKVENGALTITPAAPSAIAISADRTALAADGSAATLTFTLQDKYGNDTSIAASGEAIDVYARVTTGATAGHLEGDAETSGAWKNWTPINTFEPGGDGSYTTEDGTDSLVTSSNGGNIVVTAKAEGLTSDTVAITSTITGTPAALKISSISNATAGNGQTLTVTLVDGAGSPLTGVDYDGTVVVLDSATVGADAATLATVKAYNPATRVYDDITSSETWTAEIFKGQAKFKVYDNTAETVKYTFSSSDNLAADYTKAASGKFIAGDVDHIVIDTASPARISGNGVALTTVTARVVDAHDNTVETATGTINFKVAYGNDYATLLATSATLVNGKASVAAQSKLVTSDYDVVIRATYDINEDGDVEDTNELVEVAAFTVDATNPTATWNLSGVVGNSDTGYWLNSTAALTPAIASAPDDVKSAKFEFRNVTANGAFSALGTTDTTNDAGAFVAGAATATLVNGTQYEVKVTLTDNAGRTASLTRKFTVDTTAPTAVVAITGARTFTVTFTENFSMANATAAATYSAVKEASAADLSVASVSYNSTTKVATVTVSRDLVAGDVVGVKATAADRAGNTLSGAVEVTAE